jgi:hypothetical protein
LRAEALQRAGTVGLPYGDWNIPAPSNFAVFYPFNEITNAVINRLIRVNGNRTFQPNFMIWSYRSLG